VPCVCSRLRIFDFAILKCKLFQLTATDVRETSAPIVSSAHSDAAHVCIVSSAHSDAAHVCIVSFAHCLYWMWYSSTVFTALCILLCLYPQFNKKKTNRNLHRLNEAVNLIDKQLQQQKIVSDNLLAAEILSRFFIIPILF